MLGKNKDRVWAIVKYEKLLDFCFSCGKLGHVAKGCVEEVQRANNNQEVMRYGAHMIAVLIRNFITICLLM